VGAATPLRGGAPTGIIAFSVTVPENGTERIASWRTGRTGAGARRSLGWPGRAVQAIGAPRADFHDGPEPQGSTDEAEDTTAVRPSCRPEDTDSHGAPRAPCGRLRRCASAALTRALAAAGVQLCDVARINAERGISGTFYSTLSS
jgi:hypothetical protein